MLTSLIVVVVVVAHIAEEVCDGQLSNEKNLLNQMIFPVFHMVKTRRPLMLMKTLPAFRRLKLFYLAL